MRTGGDAQLRVEGSAASGVTPGAGADVGVAKLGANLLTALVPCANLIGNSQAIRVGFASCAELALAANTADDAELAALVGLTRANLTAGDATSVGLLAREAARVFTRGARDASAVEAGRAGVVALAIGRAVGVQIPRAGSDTQVAFGTFVAARAVRIQLARGGRDRVPDAEGLALAVDIAHVAVADLFAILVRATGVAALAFDAGETVKLVALTGRLARAKATGSAIRAAAGLAVRPAAGLAIRAAAGLAVRPAAVGRAACSDAKAHEHDGAESDPGAAVRGGSSRLLDVLGHPGTFIQGFCP